MPVDNTYQQWRTEVDEHTETTGILQQGARRSRDLSQDLVQKVVANVFQVEEQQEQVKVKKLQPDAIIPRRATTGAAGYDLYAAHDSKLEGKSITMTGTGVAIIIPPEQHGQSGPFEKAELTAFPGTTDQDHRGEGIDWKEVGNLDNTKRGIGGVGSTGQANLITERLEEPQDKHTYAVTGNLLPHQEKMIQTASHDPQLAGHKGTANTYHRFSNKHYWKEVYKDIRKYIRR